MNASVNNPPRTIRLSERDNVVIAVDLVHQGDSAVGLTARERILRGHKMAVEPIREGEPILKFGQIIGFAKAHIAPGEWVHEHNVGLHDFARDYRFCEDAGADDLLPPDMRATFQGFRRENGRTGTRNYIGILTSVNCSASVARFAAEQVNRSGVLEAYPGIDGVVSIVHGTGCGHAAYGEGFEVLRRTQWGYASHPNFAGVVMVGLGCEVFQIGRMKQEYGLQETDTFRTLTIQETGGTRKTVEAIAAAIRDMLPIVARAQRETRPASELVLALQCGGSDGYSGLTANPALGAASDLLVRHGGTSILSETPEIYGAEHLLTRRAATREIGEKLVSRIRWWEAYTERNGGEMNNNPSPGNKAGGLTTILEKSLGAIAKGGRSTLRAVYEYAEPVRDRGFVYMDTPGYDPVAATGQVAGGANLICFTTGRGSAFGAKPAPSIKLATNSDIFRRMFDDMDINCGDILDGVSIEDKGREILDMVLRVASGERTKSEVLGYGDNEFVPWQIGAVM
jgi:altronate hydrolase